MLGALLALTVVSIASADHSVFDRVSVGEVGGNGPLDSAFRDVSDDGARVFFTTEEAIASGDVDNAADVYKRFGGVTTLISRGQINGNGAFGVAYDGASADGTRVFIRTNEQLVAGDTDTATDLYERSSGTTKRVSAGQINGNGPFFVQFRGVSSSGTRVFFDTDEQLVANDTDSATDLYERSGGTTKRVSRGQINGNGAFSAIFAGASDDGTRVFFQTAERLVSGDNDTSATDVYERSGGTTKRVSAGQINGNGPISAQFEGASADGTRVFFRTSEALTANDTDSQLDVYERSGGITQLVSAGQINGNGAVTALYDGASADGTRVFFHTSEQLVANDTDSAPDVYERSGGTTKRVSRGQINGNGPSPAQFAGASADGTRVFFSTFEPLVAGDTEVFQDIYKRSGGTTKRVSAGQINGNGPFDASFAGASATGTRVFFLTVEQLAGNDTDGVTDIYERFSGTTSRVSKGQINGNGPFGVFFAGASVTGADVFFETDEQLELGDLDAQRDVYSASVP